MGAQVAEAEAEADMADMADMADCLDCLNCLNCLDCLGWAVAADMEAVDMAEADMAAASNKPAISTVAVQIRIFTGAVLMDLAASMDAPDQSRTL